MWNLPLTDCLMWRWEQTHLWSSGALGTRTDHTLVVPENDHNVPPRGFRTRNFIHLSTGVYKLCLVENRSQDSAWLLVPTGTCFWYAQCTVFRHQSLPTADQPIREEKQVKKWNINIYKASWIAQSVQWLGYRMANRGSIPGRGRDTFSTPPRPDRLCDQPKFKYCTRLLSNGYQGLFPWGVKRPGREADRSSPPSAEVKNAWSYSSTPPTSSWCGT
jgi:hypothetical protein